MLGEPQQEARRDASLLPPAALGAAMGLAPREQKLPKEMNHLCEQRTEILPVSRTLLLPVEMAFSARMQVTQVSSSFISSVQTQHPDGATEKPPESVKL